MSGRYVSPAQVAERLERSIRFYQDEQDRLVEAAARYAAGNLRDQRLAQAAEAQSRAYLRALQTGAGA